MSASADTCLRATAFSLWVAFVGASAPSPPREAPELPLIGLSAAATPDDTKALSLYNDGKFSEAIALATRVRAGHPHDSIILRIRGAAREGIGDHRGAVSDETIVLESDADDVEALTLRGQAQFNLSEYERALADAARALALDPDRILARELHGAAAYEKADYVTAIADESAAIGLTKESVFAFNYRAAAYFMQKTYAAAVADATIAVAMDNGDSWAFETLGAGNIALGHCAEAAAAFDSALKVASDRAKAERDIVALRHSLAARDAGCPPGSR